MLEGFAYPSLTSDVFFCGFHFDPLPLERAHRATFDETVAVWSCCLLFDPSLTFFLFLVYLSCPLFSNRVFWEKKKKSKSFFSSILKKNSIRHSHSLPPLLYPALPPSSVDLFTCMHPEKAEAESFQYTRLASTCKPDLSSRRTKAAREGLLSTQSRHTSANYLWAVGSLVPPQLRASPHRPSRWPLMWSLKSKLHI